jgi:hypothetical protein
MQEEPREGVRAESIEHAIDLIRTYMSQGFTDAYLRHPDVPLLYSNSTRRT